MWAIRDKRSHDSMSNNDKKATENQNIINTTETNETVGYTV